MPKWEVRIEMEIITEPEIDQFDLQTDIEACLERVEGEIKEIEIDIE